MIQKKTIIELAEDFLSGSENYLIDVLVSTTNKIRVLIDNDAHVSIQDCIALSRHIESSLDREQEDFELEVSSPGIDQPIKKDRQFLKHEGKQLEILKTDGVKITGTLDKFTGNELVIIPAQQKKTNKKVNQTSQTDNHPEHIPLNEIKEARPVIIF
jgi:ribosome maturation factor RimP